MREEDNDDGQVSMIRSSTSLDAHVCDRSDRLA